MKILFIIPVHENNDIIKNVIQNINKYIQNPIIVIHVNNSWKDFDPVDIIKYENVYINPERLSYIKYESQLPIFYSCYNYAVNNNIEFDYVCVFHTNELFIRSGIETYINYSDISHQHFPNIKHHNSMYMLRECSWILDYVNIHEIFNNHVEGNFYKKEIFENTLNFIKTVTPNLIDFKSPLEEVLIPTISYMFADKNKIKLTYLKSFYHENIPITVDTIKTLLSNHVISTYYDIPTYSNWIFSVKPVNRDMNDPVRQYINSF